MLLMTPLSLILRLYVVVEARNVNCKGHAVYCTAELKSEKNPNTPKPAYTHTAKDTKWNHTVSLYVMQIHFIPSSIPFTFFDFSSLNNNTPTR